jgi:hypothetical protein
MTLIPLEQTVIGHGDSPAFAHDVGMAGDDQGNTVSSSTLVGFWGEY